MLKIFLATGNRRHVRSRVEDHSLVFCFPPAHLSVLPLNPGFDSGSYCEASFVLAHIALQPGAAVCGTLGASLVHMLCR